VERSASSPKKGRPRTGKGHKLSDQDLLDIFHSHLKFMEERFGTCYLLRDESKQTFLVLPDTLGVNLETGLLVKLEKAAA